MPIAHSAMTGASLHPPLGHHDAGDLVIDESEATGYRATYSNTAYPILTIDTNEAAGTNAAVEFGLGCYRMSTSSRYLVIGQDWGLYDKGFICLETISTFRYYGGLIWSRANSKYVLARLDGSADPRGPYNETGVWDDVVGNGSIANYHDFHISRLLLEDASALSGATKGVYTKSDDELYFWDGSQEVQLTASGAPQSGAWSSTSTAVTANSSADIYTQSVSSGTMGWVRFSISATDGGTQQGGFSGVAHFKRESGGNVEIIGVPTLEGSGEGNIGVMYEADTAAQQFQLVGYATTNNTTFEVHYYTETRAL